MKYAGSSAIATTILEEGENTPADVVFLQDPCSLGSLAHAGLLGEIPGAQAYFAGTTREYPLIGGLAPAGDLPPPESLGPPDVELGILADSRGTLSLLREVGVIP